ncbi:hypothetical protein [Rhodoferax sp.]|uniref:hypothetical protein n=1 Tax=Rhodoferax sp. TaxID=50421 RepID=UPI00374D6774
MSKTLEQVKASLNATQRKVDKVTAVFGTVAPAPTPPQVVAAQPTLSIPPQPGKTKAQTVTAATLSPSVGAALVVAQVTHQESALDLLEVANYFKAAAVTAADGDLKPLQEMLAVQARSMDLLFNDFLRHSSLQASHDVRERYIKLAFKAQSQCRATVETLAVIQQGPAVFARNANINNGQQQVNNGVPTAAGGQAVADGTSLVPRVRGENKVAAHQTDGGNSL